MELVIGIIDCVKATNAHRPLRASRKNARTCAISDHAIFPPLKLIALLFLTCYLPGLNFFDTGALIVFPEKYLRVKALFFHIFCRHDFPFNYVSCDLIVLSVRIKNICSSTEFTQLETFVAIFVQKNI